MFLKTTTNHIVTMVRWYQHQVWSRWFYLLRIPFPASHFSLFLFSPFSSTFNNVSMSNVKRQQKKYQKNKFLSLRVADVVVFTEERERDRDHQPPPTTNLCGERKRMKKMHRHSSSSSSSSISSSSSARTSASASASALTSSTKREFCLLFQRILPSSLASSFVDVCLILYLLLTRICPSYSYHSFQQQRECC